MRLATSVPAVLLSALLAGSASSEIYRWTDSEGRLHFTERLERVPLDQRDAAVESVMRTSEPDPAAETPASHAFDEPEATQPPVSRLRSQRHSQVVVPFVREGTLMRVDAVLNDTVTAPFLVDTGASGVSLPSELAQQLGIRVRPDTPHIRVGTANGVVSRPVVRLDAVEVGGARVEGLYATLNPSMEIGLLGGAFFNNFIYRVDAGAGVITLTPTDLMRGGMGEADWRRRFRSLIDPLTRLNAHLASDVVRRQGEKARLEQRRRELEAALEELQSEANRLDVPHAWRQ
jgi:clan AA aspartic protease (TIGR02281 family)